MVTTYQGNFILVEYFKMIIKWFNEYITSLQCVLTIRSWGSWIDVKRRKIPPKWMKNIGSFLTVELHDNIHLNSLKILL